jgi:HEAT repeat protein
VTPNADQTSIEAARRRGEAATAGHGADEATARSLLDDQDQGVRATALGALVRMGNATAADAAAALADPDPWVRRYACELGASLPEADFVALLGDPDDTVVEAACFATGEVRAAQAVPALIQIAAAHTDALCRESAVAALGAIGDQHGLPAVIAALEDRPQIRRRAAVALAIFDHPDSEAALRRCLQDPDWQVRQAAEDILGVAGPEA